MQTGISDMFGIPEQAAEDTIQCAGEYPTGLLFLFVVVSDFNSSLFIQP